MPRGLLFFIILLIAIIGLLWFFSRQAEEVPTRSIEVNVSAENEAG